MVPLATILTGVTLVFTFYIAYKSKATAVESAQDRQKILTERCGGQNLIGNPTIIRVESVEFEPNKKGIKNWFLEEHPGSSVVSISFLNVYIDPSFLEQLGKEPKEFGDLEAEELETKVVGDTVMTSWRIQTNDPDKIQEFIRGFANASDEGLQQGEEYVRLTGEASIT